MNYLAFSKQLKTNDFGKIYLFHGQEAYAKEKMLQQFIEVLVEPSFRDFNVQILDGSTARVENIIEMCETFPMMGGKRVILVKESAFFKTGKEGAEQDDIERMAQYLTNIPETTCLVFYFRGNVDRRTRMYQAFKKVGQEVDFEPLEDTDLLKHLSKMFADQGLSIAKNEINYLIFRCGNHLNILQHEVEKLVSYCMEKRTINKTDIDAVTAESLEYTVFNMVDSLAKKKANHTLALMEDAFLHGQSGIYMLVMMARQFRILLYFKWMQSAKYQQADIQRVLEIPAFAMRDIMHQADGFTEAQLRQALSDCVRIDNGLKSGQMRDEKAALEGLVMRCCHME